MEPEAPDTAYLAGYLKTGNIPPEDLQLALDQALEQQAARCLTVPYTHSLKEAACRRAARILAARGAPLGALDLGPMGSSPLSRYDAVLEELEGPYLLAPIGGRDTAAEAPA